MKMSKQGQIPMKTSVDALFLELLFIKEAVIFLKEQIATISSDMAPFLGKKVSWCNAIWEGSNR